MGDDGRVAGLAMVASALAGRSVAVAPLERGEPSWTDGQTVFVDLAAGAGVLESIAVQASLIAAGSLDVETVRPMSRKSRLAARYLALEGHRALAANADLLPGTLARLSDPAVASRTDSPAVSLSVATGNEEVSDPPAAFGVMQVKKVLAAGERAAKHVDHDIVGKSQRPLVRGQRLDACAA
jgi:hypothetical protein